MQCKQAIEFMSDHLETALPDLLRDRFECHLAACRDCSLYRSQMQMTIAVARRLGKAKGTDPELYRTLLAGNGAGM